METRREQTVVPAARLARIASGALVAAGAAAFVALNAWAFAETGVPNAAEFFAIPMRSLATVIPAHRWTTVIAADLMLGWLAFAVVIAARERSRLRAALWIAVLFGIGNVVSCAYLLVELAKRKGGGV